jgi:hypothetical protein
MHGARTETHGILGGPPHRNQPCDSTPCDGASGFAAPTAAATNWSSFQTSSPIWATATLLKHRLTEAALAAGH